MDKSKILSDPELRRFSGQLSLPQVGLEGQEKLKKAVVAVIGAGGLGSVVLQYLASVGVGHLGIIDYSMVEEKNIQRQVLYGGNDLGKLKAIISKQQLQNVFPLVNFEIINIQLTSNNVERILAPFSVIVDATNNQDSHLMITDACKRLKIPMIYGKVSGLNGEVGVSHSEARLESGMEWKDNCAANNLLKGTISVTYGLIGNLVAFETLKVITGAPGLLINKRLCIDLLNYQFVVK
jgi:Dinucleotide-utilizing enzymes involved in molybdopterin and thiamine biosynthesis family 2